MDLSERAASNEEVVRGVNALVEQGRAAAHVERMPFHCECGHGGCAETVDLTPHEYDRVANFRFAS